VTGLRLSGTADTRGCRVEGLVLDGAEPDIMSLRYSSAGHESRISGLGSSISLLMEDTLESRREEGRLYE
jgi:hypothetical protein